MTIEKHCHGYQPWCSRSPRFLCLFLQDIPVSEWRRDGRHGKECLEKIGTGFGLFLLVCVILVSEERVGLSTDKRVRSSLFFVSLLIFLGSIYMFHHHKHFQYVTAMMIAFSTLLFCCHCVKNTDGTFQTIDKILSIKLSIVFDYNKEDYFHVGSKISYERKLSRWHDTEAM